MKHPIICLLLINLLCFTASFSQEKRDSNLFILSGATIINGGTSEGFVGYVVIESSKIIEVGKGEYGEIPSGATWINLEGYFLVPGYIDAHVHFGTDPSGYDNLAATKERLRYLLINGITSARDMAGDTRYLSFLKRSADLNEIDSPNLYYSSLMAGPAFFDDERTHSSAKGAIPGEAIWMKGITEETNIMMAVAEAKGTGATGIKIYSDLGVNLVRSIVEEGHAQGIKIWSHATIFPAKPFEIVATGMDVISHAPLLAWETVDYLPSSAKKRYVEQSEFDVDDEAFIKLLKEMKSRGTILDATLATYKNERFKEKVYSTGVAATKKAYEMGVKIGVGTDIDLFELPEIEPLFQEIDILVNEVGMTPAEVLYAATMINAEIIGIESETGSIEAGKRADLVVLKESPILDIKNASDIYMVIKQGHIVR